MVFFSPQPQVAPRGSFCAEDFETALLNEPLREFQRAVRSAEFKQFTASHGLSEAIDRALQPRSNRVQDQSESDLEVLRLLAVWSLEETSFNEPCQSLGSDVQKALAFVSARLLPEDRLCRFAVDLVACRSEVDLDSRIEQWNAERDAMVLCAPLSVERFRAVEALGRAMREWQQSNPTQIPISITTAQWRLLISVIRPTDGLLNGGEEAARGIRGLLRRPLQAMQKAWSAGSPSLTSDPVDDLNQKIVALQTSLLAEATPSEIWEALESVQQSWIRGAEQPPQVFEKVQEYFGIKARTTRPRVSVLASRTSGHVPVSAHNLAFRVLRKQTRGITEGGQGVRIPLLPRRAVLTQLHDGRSFKFREKYSVEQPPEVCVSTSAESLAVPTPSEIVNSTPPTMQTLHKLFGAELLNPDFRILEGPDQLNTIIETEMRVIYALLGSNPDRDLVAEALLEYIDDAESGEGEWRLFLVESLQMFSQTADFQEWLMPLVERLLESKCSRIQEWLCSIRKGDQLLSSSDEFDSILGTLQGFEQYLARIANGAVYSFGQHQETWESLLLEATSWNSSLWARVQFLAAGLKGLQLLEKEDSEVFDGALEALGCPEAASVASILQRLYGQSLVMRAENDAVAQKQLSSLQQTLSVPAWHGNWGPLAVAIGTTR